MTNAFPMGLVSLSTSAGISLPEATVSLIKFMTSRCVIKQDLVNSYLMAGLCISLRGLTMFRND